MNHTLNVRPVNRYQVKPEMGREFRELDFGTVHQVYRKNIRMCMKELNQM